MTAHAVPKPAVIPMGVMGVLVRSALASAATYCWWNYNIVYGNAVAIEALGIFAALPEVRRQVIIPVVGSVSQLYWDEDFDLGVLRHPSMGAFCIVVGILDVLGLRVHADTRLHLQSRKHSACPALVRLLFHHLPKGFFWET